MAREGAGSLQLHPGDVAPMAVIKRTNEKAGIGKRA